MEILNPGSSVKKTGVKLLPAFCKFVKENFFHAYLREMIFLAKEVDIPLMRYFSHMNDEELLQFSIPAYEEYFEAIINDKTDELIRDSIRQWLDDKLEVVNKNQIVVADIQLVCYVRKQGLIDLIPEYTLNPRDIIQLTKEIDRFFLDWEMRVMAVYSDVLKDQIEEHVHFIHKLNNTMPGVFFVLDLENQKITFINDNCEEIFGYEKEDIISMGSSFIKHLIHPNDQDKFYDHLQRIKNIKDTAIEILTFRTIKNNSEIKILRTYDTIFKRNHNNEPIEITGIVIDVTSEEEMAERLAKREEELFEAHELADIGTFQWNLVTLEGEISSRVEQMLHLNPTDNYDDFLMHIHPGDRKRVKSILNTAFEQKSVFDCEFRYLTNEIEKIIWCKGKFSQQNGMAIIRGTIMDVTERHHVIQRLQRSDDLYKQAQAMTHIGNYTYDLNTHKYVWSEELYRIYDIPFNTELNRELIATKNYEEDIEKLESFMDQLMLTHQPQEIYYRIYTASGELKYLHAKGEVLVDENGVPFKIFGTVQDVTIQKLFEIRLEENQNFIQKVADATPSIVCVYNLKDGEYIFINKAIEQILGYNPDEVLERGMDFFDSIIHPEDLQEFKLRNSAGLTENNPQKGTEKVVEFHYRMKHANGTYHWFSTYGTVFDRDKNGEVLHVLNISLDITDQVNAKRQIEEQKYFIEHITNASPTIIYLLDIKNKKMKYVNEEIAFALGYQPEEILEMGENVFQIYHPEDFKKILSTVKSTNRERFKVNQFECRLRSKNKKWKWFLINEVPFRTEKGETVEVLGAALDITSRKEMENALNEKTVQLQRSNASLEEFAYVASHDLKEPLRKISAFGDRLMTSQKDLLDENGKTYLQKIVNSSVRMQRMVDDLLALSMISSNKSFTVIDFNEALDDVLKTLEVKIEEKKAVIISDKLPVTEAIPSQIVQLFQNLISNSLKFTDENRQPEIRITCDTIEQKDVPFINKEGLKRFYKISFADNGIGFDPQFAEKIFSIFQRLHGRSEFEGTGIGLAICRKIAENHGGYINATGVLDQGATFTVYIPKYDLKSSV